MTVIVNTIWGGRGIQVVDRQISRRQALGSTLVVDEMSTKACVVLCSNALVSIAYTGVAVANGRWMDTVIASCLSGVRLDNAMIQPGSPLLARPIHLVVQDLATNLNGHLNTDPRARTQDLQLSMVGWHLGRRPAPFSWKLVRGPIQKGGMRYFFIERDTVGKFLRENPRGLHAETLGDPGCTVDDGMRALGNTMGYMHDDVERHVKNLIVKRAEETRTVGGESLAIQLDPFDSEGQVQITRYPGAESEDPAILMTCWLLAPRLACSPGTESTWGCAYSACGNYMVGGFSDGSSKLKVRTRLPLEKAYFGGPNIMRYGTQERRVAI